jgi:nicotinate-nucleotide adenylyltransferase
MTGGAGAAGDALEAARGALGIFGGTFDPIHVAHLAVAEAARDALDLRRVLFVPAARPPHKAAQRVSHAADRLAMVRAAIADNDAFAVSTVELERDGPSYTIDTLRELATYEGADTRLALILSAEAFADFPSWRDPAAIPGVTEPRIVVLDGPRMQLSASELRARARAGRSVRYLVPDAVATYIGDHALYQDHQKDTAR